MAIEVVASSVVAHGRAGVGVAGAVVLDVVANYRDKLEALTQLVSAVAAGDADAERSAALQVQSAAAEGNRLANRLARVARQLGCPPSICMSLE